LFTTFEHVQAKFDGFRASQELLAIAQVPPIAYSAAEPVLVCHLFVLSTVTGGRQLVLGRFSVCSLDWQLFQRCLIKVLNIDLWRLYLLYIRESKASLPTYK
jgi:hypothetical protein